SEMRAERVALDAKVDRLDLADPTWRGAAVHLRLVRAEMQDARALQALVPTNVLAVESGRARVDADVELAADAHHGAGAVDVTLDRAGVRFHDTRFSGDFALRVPVSGFDAERHAIDVSGTKLTMRGVRVTGASAETKGWSADVVLGRGAIVWLDEPR